MPRALTHLRPAYVAAITSPEAGYCHLSLPSARLAKAARVNRMRRSMGEARRVGISLRGESRRKRALTACRIKSAVRGACLQSLKWSPFDPRHFQWTVLSPSPSVARESVNVYDRVSEENQGLSGGPESHA